MANPVQKRPEGFHSVTPYLVVDGAIGVMEFLKRAFDANDFGQPFIGPDGKVMHAALQIGDSIVEIGDSAQPMAMNLHMYVDDVDGIYRRALAAGGVSVREPETTFYGDRSAGVKDPGGNTWWLACHVEDISDEEVMRRSRAR